MKVIEEARVQGVDVIARQGVHVPLKSLVL